MFYFSTGVKVIQLKFNKGNNGVRVTLLILWWFAVIDKVANKLEAKNPAWVTIKLGRVTSWVGLRLRKLKTKLREAKYWKELLIKFKYL